jgi:pimeloyl-ACP methyl ester carboxylesterase
LEARVTLSEANEQIRWIDAPGARLRAIERDPGGTPALLFLHGWLDHARGFDWLIEALGPGLRTVALDFRGQGQSSHVPGGLYHVTDYVADVELTLDACGLERVHLVGHSLGGTIAFLYAAARPERVASVTSIESLGPSGGAGERSIERIRRFVADLHKPRLKRVYPSEAEAGRKLHQNNPHLSEAAAIHLARHGTRAVEGGVEFTFDPAHRRMFGASLDEDQTLAFLGAIECPVQIIAATRGYSMDEATTRRRLAALRNPPVHRVEGGHHVHLDSPREVADLVRTFAAAQV